MAINFAQKTWKSHLYIWFCFLFKQFVGHSYIHSQISNISKLDIKIKWTKTNVIYKGKKTSLKKNYLVPRSYKIKLYNRGRKDVNVGKTSDSLWFGLYCLVHKSYIGLVCHTSTHSWFMRIYGFMSNL